MLGCRTTSACVFVPTLLALALASCSDANSIPDSNVEVTPPLPTTFGASRLVAGGTYRSLLVDPWDDRSPVVITFDFTNGGPYLALRPIDGRLGCNAGPAVTSRIYDKLPNRVQLVAYANKAADGTASLTFVDHNCDQYGPTIAGTDPGDPLPLMLYADPPGYLVKVVANANAAPGTQLLVVDPWNRASKVLASDVGWYSFSSTSDGKVYTYVIDGGHYRVFDSQQVLQADIGTAVTEVAYQGTKTGPFFLVDGGVLRRYQSIADTHPVDIASDACQLTNDGNGGLYFLSPCASGQLQRYRFYPAAVSVIDTSVTALVATRNSGTGDPDALYTKPNSSASQDLWLFSPGAAPSLTVTNFNRLYDWSAPPNSAILALANADAVRGQLIQHDDTGDTLLLDAVSVGFSQGLLANFDPIAAVGDLYTAAKLGAPPQFVASGVPYVKTANTIVTSTNSATISYGTAVVANATAGVGDLQLIRYPNESSPGPDAPVTVASASPAGKAQFFNGMLAIGYIENWTGTLDSGQGHLAVTELKLNLQTNISDDVREFIEIRWPSEAILYTVPNGDRAGIWIAEAK